MAYSLSYRDVEEFALERGLKVDPLYYQSLGYIQYAPILEEVFRKCHKRPAGNSWRMDGSVLQQAAWDESRPLIVGLQELIINHRKLL